MLVPGVKSTVKEDVVPVVDAVLTPDVLLATEALLSVMVWPLPDRSVSD